MSSNKKHPRITLLGNNSGRNLGDAAILSSILDSFSKALPNAEFFVPTIAPKWVRKHYGEHYNVRPLDAMPWTGSVRLLGIPTLWAIAKSDITLICDGIIFGVKLFNPTFNYLITLIFLVPWARLVGSKVVCYSCGIGPFPGFWSRHFARWVINASDLVIMRDEDSKELAESIGVTKAISVTGDAAFVNPVSSHDRAQEIAREERIDLTVPIIAVNVTKYIDTWLAKGQKVDARGSFLDTMADGLIRAREQIDQKVQFLVFSTQPMDETVSYQLADKIGAKVIDNTKYLSHDIQAMMRPCGLMVGMRFHSLVLSTAVNVPCLGLVYAPKVRGFMRLLDCEAYSLELAEITPELLAERVQAAWQEREQLWEKQNLLVSTLKAGAEQATLDVARHYFVDDVMPVSPPRDCTRSEA